MSEVGRHAGAPAGAADGGFIGETVDVAVAGTDAAGRKTSERLVDAAVQLSAIEREIDWPGHAAIVARGSVAGMRLPLGDLADRSAGAALVVRLRDVRQAHDADE